jgi:DNA ligase-1
MHRLADVLEAVSGTASKLKKIELLAGYLQTLTDDELRIACTYLTGAPFPAGDGRALNVGWSALLDALREVAAPSDHDLDQAYLKYGDLGSVVGELLTRKVRTPLFVQPLTLVSVDGIFSQLAASVGKGSRQVKLEAMRAIFENATPLEAKYLARIITSDMRVGLKEGLLEEAVGKAFSQSLADVRRANMLISDIGAVAVLARHGRLGEAALRLFRPFRFMLADTIFAAAEAFEPVRGDEEAHVPAASLLVEEKYDGVRAQVHFDGTRLAIFSRTLDEITASFPDLHAPLRALADRYILDGEIVAWQDGRAIPFTQLQQRLRRKDPTELIATVPVVLMAFDILHLNGDDLLDRPLADRRRHLDTLQFGATVQASYATVATRPEELDVRFREARTRGNEGLVIKRPTGLYQPGKRGRQWVKWKEELATLDVVVVAAEQGHGKRAGVLSDVTFAVRAGDQLTPVGKAYSGLTDVEIAALTEWFRAHTLVDRGRVKLVEPKIVLEVAFDAVTRSPRHASGYALRFPRIKRIRDDKVPEEINTLDDVARIFTTQGASRGGSSPKLTPSRADGRGERG